MKFAIYSLAGCAVASLLPIAATAEPRSATVSAETRQAAQALAARFAGDAEAATKRPEHVAITQDAPAEAGEATDEAPTSSLMAGLAHTARAAGDQAAQNPDALIGNKPKPAKRAKRNSPAEAVPEFATTTTKRKAPPQAVAASDDPPTIGMRPRDGVNDSEPVDISKIFKPSQWFGGDDKQSKAGGTSAAFTE